MALVLLNPGLRPLGQFDMNDGETVRGCELANLAGEVLTTEGYAADVGTGGGSGIIQDSPAEGVNFSLGSVTEGTLCGLTDDGTDNYGTLFGTAISMFGTGMGTQSTRGVVTIGPKTDLASGKVTIWAQQGLYGVTTDALSDDSTPAATTAANDPLYGEGNTTRPGALTTAGDGKKAAINVGMQRDRSLVSTTAAAAGETAVNDHLVVFFVGQQILS